MQVSVEVKEGLVRELHVEIPAEQVNAALERELQMISRNVKLPGFRPGKVPMSHIRKQFGAKAMNDVARSLVDDTIENAVVESKVTCAGVTKIDVASIDKDKPFKYTASVEVYPELDVKDLKGLDVEKDVAEITDADKEKMLSNLRKQNATWTDVQRTANSGDKVTIDFEGRLNGEVLPKACGQGFDLELGSNSMIPGFEDAIIGMNIGQSKTEAIVFPADYFETTMAGQSVEFTFTLHAVQEIHLPELNDELAASFNVKEGGIEALRTELVKSMHRELKNRLKAQIKQAVIEKFLSANELDLPSVLVTQEVGRVKNELLAQLKIPKDQATKLNLPDDMFLERAKGNVKLSLLLGEYIKKHTITASDDIVNQLIDDIAEGYEDKENVINYYKHNKKRLQQVNLLAIEDLAIQKLLESANVVEKQLSYEEVMQKTQQR